MIGCAVARALARRGLATVLVERGELGAEASRAAAGMVAPQAETDRPGPLLELGLASRRLYPEFVAVLQAESGVDVEYRTDGILGVGLDAADMRELGARARWQRQFGLRATDLTPAAARRLCPALPRRLRGAVLFPDDHRVNNERLALAAGLAARRAGVTVFERTRALAVEARGGRVCGVHTAAGGIETGVVVNALGAWAAGLQLPSGVAPPPVMPVRGQMIVLRAPVDRLPLPVCGARAYLVPRLDGRILLGSTREQVGFEKRVTMAAAAELLSAAVALAPGLASATVEGAYAGLRPGTADDLPILGAAPSLPGLFYAAGLYRNGILLAPAVATALAELIADGRTALPAAPFRPRQRPSRWRSVASSPGVRKA